MKKNIEIDQKCTRCGVEYAFKRIGGKYKARIIWHLGINAELRFGELGRVLPDVSTKMLTQALRELESDELITRKMYHEVPPKVEYSLTTTARQLIPFLEHLNDWGHTQIRNESVSTVK
ncbi:winged helix-turn-helix transcriptional regulator [Flavobacterium sp. CF136]|uniref:winged helix-turn-helix transcriptional regulator n=1 Tax=Flavobacterium sp. (strain CF136) TaxID=1144313 RepID=UPI0002718562|nr:helix-turn-helix domain-containing protein [Flavobacterium sp. CF136]EJL63955.1 putative transcriptional regulator [Flavobacterium sp. CF136]